MELLGLSVIEVRNLVSSEVGYAYLGNGFLCTHCVLENSGLCHGRKRNKNPRVLALLVALRKALKAVKDLWVSEIDGSFFVDKNLLKHWPIKIGRKSKTAQLWMESLYAPLWPECLYAYPVGKKFSACQVNWQIRSSSHAEKRSCQSEYWLSIRKKWFSYGA